MTTRRLATPRLDSGVVLLLTPVLWGATFPAAKLALDDLSPWALMAWTRFLGLVTIVIALPWIERGPRGSGSRARDLVGPGAILGALLFLGYALQTLGLQFTTATNAGFITGLYVVFTPLLGVVLFRQAAGRAAWIAVTVSVIGLALLSTRTLTSFTPRAGDVLVLCCAVAWAGHVVALGRLAPRYPAISLAVAQMAAATAFHAVAAIPAGLQPSDAAAAVPLLVITGVLGTGVAYTLQIVAQRELDPVRTAVILSGESLVAALLSIVWIDERLTLHQWLGATLILGAMVLSETRARRRVVAPLPVGTPSRRR